jgi:DNA polymerase Pol2
MSFSRLVENYIFNQCRNYNELAPNKPDSNQLRQRHSRTYEGAFVFQPTPGLYTSVVVFDFRSLYPSIITAHNVSPSSYRCSCCHEVIPGTNDWFCQKKKGFLSAVLENIITRRMRIKEMLKTSEKNTLLEARSNALKLLANAFYGYLGFAPARWYSFESASSITALGRYHINNVIQRAQSAGFSVLYSDTDSIFLELKDKSEKDALAFIDSINADLPGLMELDYEGFYPTGIFVSAKAGSFGAKKKYALLDKKGKLKIRGFEMVRRNWSFVAKDVQETVLNIILKEKDITKAFEYVKDTITQIQSHSLPLDKMIIATQLQKATDAYDNAGPHVAVARRMIERGIAVSPGLIIKYIITTGKGSVIRDRAKMPEEVINNDYDADYYINNQIVPSVDRLFAVFGINLAEALLPKTQSTLGQWF